MSESNKTSWSEIFGAPYGAVTATLCLGVALLAFNAFLASTALPTAVRELDGLALLSWATTLYLVMAIVGGSAAALLKARFGARAALFLAALGFLLGTLIAASALGMPQVLAGRVVQGFCEGVVAAICYALIPELYPSRLVPRIFGIEAAMWGVAAFGGPVVAGSLTQFVSWRAAFLINVPFALLFAGLAIFVAPHGRRNEAAGFPGLRLLAIGGGILCVAIAGLTPAAEAAALLVAAAVLLVGAVWLDRRSPARLFPQGAFAPTSVVGAGLWVVLLQPIGAAAVGTYLVITLQQVWGFGALLAGGFSAVMAVGWSTSAVLVAGVRTLDMRLRLVRLGAGLVVLGLAGVPLALVGGGVPTLLLALASAGVGFGISWGFLSQTLMEAAPTGERDRTSALLPTLQSAGNAIGAALAGLAANAAGFAVAATPAAVRGAVLPALLLGISVALVALLAALRTTALAGRRVAAGPALAPSG